MRERPIVYVVDDDANLRRAVIWLLESVGHKVKGFESAEDVLPEIDDDAFGCLLTDMRMPRRSGLSLLEAVKTRQESFPVILMTAYGTVKSGVRAMKLGALDYIEKPFDEQQLLDLIDNAIDVSRKNRVEQALKRRLVTGTTNLSRREREVLQGVILGKKNDQIAASLDISAKTVETYRSRILVKMGFDSIDNLCLHLKKYSISLDD
ncbi:MAG: response regulator [Rhodospirillales bacterium]